MKRTRKARRRKAPNSGGALVKLLQESPLRDIKIKRLRTRSRVRDVKL